MFGAVFEQVGFRRTLFRHRNRRLGELDSRVSPSSFLNSKRRATPGWAAAAIRLMRSARRVHYDGAPRVPGVR